jgi:Protein of unknown function (DUF3433)
VLTVGATFWALVEYRAKQMAPWHEIAQTPTSAARSVLIDYISPLMPISLVASIRKKHYPVALVIFGSVLMKLLIIASTGLFTLDRVLISQDGAQLIATDEFTSKLGSVGPLPVEIIQGHQYFDLQLPSGTTNEFAFQDFTSQA